MFGENEFRIIEVKPEPVSRVPRERAIGLVREYRGEDGFVALISDAVIERLCTLSHNSEPSEWLGILVGRVGEDVRGAYVVVDGVILDQNAVATPGSVHSTFVGERRVREIAAAAHCGSSVIGWAHAHYRCGTRFSGGDRDNQATWPAAHALGIVCDPRTPERIGVYRGPQSERLTRASASEPVHSDKFEASGSEVRAHSANLASADHSLPEDRDESTTGEYLRPSSGGLKWTQIVTDIAKLAFLVLTWHLWTRVSDMHARIDVLERTVQTLDARCSRQPTLESPQEPFMSFIQPSDEREQSNRYSVQPMP